jgi:SLOG in TRPM, prokaryote
MVSRVGGPAEVRAQGGASVSPSTLGVLRTTPVLVVAGTTRTIENDLAVRLLPVLKATVAFAAERGVAIVTGGTDAGVFHLLGLALSAAPARPPIVVGVAPDALVAGPDDPVGEGGAPVDPQLDVLLRVPGERWGDETIPLSRLVADLAGAEPTALLLVGGGDVSRADLREHLAQGRPVIALDGTGRLADSLAGEVAAGADDLPALVAAGDVTSIPLDSRAVQRQLRRVLGRRHRDPRAGGSGIRLVLPKLHFRPGPPDAPVPSTRASDFPLLHTRLSEAERLVYPAFAECDRRAKREQNRNRWFSLMAILGALGTTVAGAAQVLLADSVWPGVVVATLGGGTSALTTYARRQGTLATYLDARTRAERLRALYFIHLARPPAPTPAGAQSDAHDLERRVKQILSGPVSA